MENLSNLSIEFDEENGLTLTMADSDLFDYVEEFLIDTAPEVYAAIESVEIGPEFERATIYFAETLSQVELTRILAGMDKNRLLL